MKRFLTALAVLAVAGAAFADRTPVRLPIRHADPWLVKAMLEGIQIRTPEMSSLPGFAGLMAGAANGAQGFIKNGFLMVNPTDNSLWFIPDK